MSIMFYIWKCFPIYTTVYVVYKKPWIGNQRNGLPRDIFQKAKCFISVTVFTQQGLLTEMTIKPNDLSENALSLGI